MKISLFLGLFFLSTLYSEEKVPMVPLGVYTGGIGAGAFYAMNEELRQESQNFLKLTLANNIYLREYLNLFLDIDWLLPGVGNWGGNLGIDLITPNAALRPLIGFGVGFHHLDKDGKFGENLGPSFTAHAGLLLDLTEELQIRIRVPYHFIANEHRDQLIGLDVSFLLGSKFRNVKKYKYN